ncbi:MAG TPA: carboxypeptidase-like regulatory domain-containing protein [Chitinophagaceae bacterium]|jgi:Cna protein B-type domain.
MKNKIFLSIAFSLFTFLFTHAADPDPMTSATNPCKKSIISGSINHADSKKPIKEVNVTAYLSAKKEKVVITDGNGNYAFDDLKPGTYKFIFQKDGYKKVTKERVTVKPDETFMLNIEMIDDGVELVPSPFHFSN